jgi:hypothetical protein
MKNIKEVEQDVLEGKFLTPEEAVQYGLIDGVLYPGSDLAKANTLFTPKTEEATAKPRKKTKH